jgi:hypothetical protein
MKKSFKKSLIPRGNQLEFNKTWDAKIMKVQCNPPHKILCYSNKSSSYVMRQLKKGIPYYVNLSFWMFVNNIEEN